jgi:hypothetical protein
MYDESIQRALRRHKIKPITLPAPLIQTLIANFKGDSPRSQIITGTAGDGKTYHCREVWTALGGSDDVWNDSEKVKTVEIGCLSLTIVKDLSELRDDESSALMENFARDVVNASSLKLYLLAANHGQLLEKLKSAPQTTDILRIGKSIEDLLVTGRTADEGVLLGLSDLSRSPAADTAMQIVDAIIRRQSHGSEEHYLPARQISFQDSGLKSMFDEVHGIAEWVATYDDLLDKRQLAAQGINVIRYRRQRTHGRNMVVSSTSELRLLHVLVRRRLTELSLGLDDDRLSNLARRLIEDANSISGDIVLRAAKRGVSAGELIGLVLSRALVAEELGQQTAIAWFLLDDYAEWLGQREEGIADILALSVSSSGVGGPRLRAVVTEAKYVDSSGSAEASRKSRQQLRQTVARITIHDREKR